VDGSPFGDVHYCPGFGIFGAARVALADTETTEAPDLHPLPINQGGNDRFQSNVYGSGYVFLVYPAMCSVALSMRSFFNMSSLSLFRLGFLVAGRMYDFQEIC